MKDGETGVPLAYRKAYTVVVGTGEKEFWNEMGTRALKFSRRFPTTDEEWIEWGALLEGDRDWPIIVRDQLYRWRDSCPLA